MTTIKQINKALKEENIDGQIVKGKGYFYFIGGLFDKVSSIYSFNLSGWTTEQVINHIKKDLTKQNC